VLNAEECAIEQIHSHLAGRSDIACVALVSEGSPASLNFAAGSLSLDSLARHKDRLKLWSDTLASGADLLLYSCRVAEGEDGARFVRELAEITGLDVAASSNLTGPAELGGDTVLEVAHGEINGRFEALETLLEQLPAVLGYNDLPVVNNPGAQATNEDTNFVFGSTIVVNEPGSDRMEIVVRVTAGSATLSDGEISDTELAAQGSRAALNTFLNTLALVPAANWNGSATLEVTVTSDFNNRHAGNTTSFTFGMTVNAVNDAPVATGSSSLAAVNEDTANPSGATVSTLFSARFNDSTDTVAGGSSANAFAGVAIVGNTVNAAQGQWQYFNGSSWTNVGARSASSTFLLPMGDSLRFLPAANWFGTPSNLTVRLIDNSSGAVVRGPGPDLSNASNHGGTTVYSAATVALSTSINPVNDAPVTANFNISATKNQVATFSLTSTDADTGSNSTTDAIVTTYRIVTLPSNGTLRSSTNSIISAPNTDITVAQATNMTFTPDTNYEGPASFTFRAIDAASAQSNTSTASIDVQPFNEPPVVTVPGPATVNEDTSLNLIGTASVADPDAASARIRATVTATNGTVTLSQLTGLFDAESGGNAIGTATFTSLTFYGTLANLNGALTGLRYTPTTDYFGAATVTVTVNDLANTGNPAKEDTGVINITVTNVPDAPVTGPATLAAVNEDTISPGGATVGALLAGFSDADGDALAGIAISANTTNATTEGRWQYSVNSGMSWSNVGTVSSASALLVNSAARLRFLPVQHYYGTPAPLAIHAVDSSGSRTFTTHPSTRQTLNVSFAGSDYHAAGNVLGTSITSVNDIFTVVNDYPLLVDEGGTSVLTSARLSITDIEAGPSSIVYTILAIGTNLDEGVFEFDTTGAGAWAAIGPDDTFTQAHINAGRLRYVHNGDEPAAPQTLAYSVTDLLPGAGGTTENRVLTILISPVNDAPELYVPGQTPPGDMVALNGNAPFDTTHTFTTSNFRVVDSDNLDVQLIFRIESLPVNGKLRFNNAPMAVGSVFSYADLGLFTYRHDGTATVTDAFSISLRDGAGGIVGAAGGTPATPVVVNLDIVPYNNPPTVTNRSIEILEWDQNVPFTFIINDVETDPADLVVRILTLPPAGEAILRFNGSTITQGMVDAPEGFTFAANQLHLLTMNHTTPERVTPPDFSFDISVTDDDEFFPATTDATINILVRPVDDEPTLTVADIALPAAGATHILTDENLEGEDVDTPAATLLYRLEVRPVNGTLFLNGIPVGVGGAFTQDDVNEGRVTYVHRGWASTTDSFQVTLRDQGYNIRYDRPGGVYPDTISKTLLAHTINIGIPAGGSNPASGGTSGDPGQGGIYPVVARTDYLETDKNIPVTVHQNALFANDGGITPFSIVGVQMKAGFEADGVVNYNAGTSEITFTPTINFSGVTQFEYTMEDALARQDTADVIVTVYYVNYPPAITTNSTLVLDEDAEATISQALLEAEDIDDAPENLTYTLHSDPDNGRLYLDSTPGDSVADAERLRSGDIFTQADINAGRIKFSHNGNETFLSSFIFRVTDGANPDVPLEPAFATFNIDTTPVNDRPVIESEDEDFILLEGGAFVLTNTELDSHDVDGVGSDKEGIGFATINTLTYSMTEAGHLPVNGTLQYFDGSDWQDLGLGDDFTPAQVAAGEVRYLHDGTETTADAITVTLDDNTGEPNATISALLNIGVVPVNDDPVIAKNEPLVLDEATGATITFADHLQGEDPDNTDIQVQFRITTTTRHGTLWLDGVEALGVGSKFTNQDLKDGKLSYQHDGSESTSDDFHFTLSDGGGGNEPADIFLITINSVNDAPVVTLPAPSIYAVENEETDILGILVSDDDSIHPVTLSIDQDFGPMLLTLSVTGGVLDVREDLATVTGAGTGTVTVEGTLGEINDTLFSLIYIAGPVAAETGADTLSVTINDQGNTGAGGPLSDTENLAIIMLGVNNPPVVSVPGAQSVNEDTALVFSAGFSNALSFTDPDIDTGSATATLSVSHGTLTLGSVAGLGSVSGDGTGSVSLTGTMAAINNALNGLSYQGAQNYHGPDTLTFTVNDQGNTGTFGGPLSDNDTVAITVNPVNDTPTVANLDFNVNEDGVLTLSLASIEVDTGTDPEDDAVVTHYFIEVFAALVGELRTSDNVLLDFGGSVTPGGFAALPAGQHVITAAQATNMTYTPPAEFNSALPGGSPDWRSAFQFRAIDVLGADYAASSKSAVAVADMEVNAVNDAPVLAGGGDSVNYTEGSGLDAQGSATILNAAGDLTVADMEVTVQGADDFGSATVTVRRSPGAFSTDRFGLAENDGISLSGANVIIGGTTRAVITNNSASGILVITFSADASQAHVHTILRNVSYASVANDLHGAITAMMVFNDGNAGAQGSGGPLNSNTINFSINVENVNDSPAFASNGLVTVAEDTAAPAGASVDTIMGARFTDPDPVALDAGQFAGIAITADASNQTTQGRWQYSANGTDWHDVTPAALPAEHPSATNALLLNKDSLLRFIPVADFNDRFEQANAPAGALTVVAVDDSGARTWTTNVLKQFTDTVTGWDDTSDLGSAGPALVNVSTTQVNDQPVITNLDDDSTFTEAVGVNVAGPAVLLDDPGTGAAAFNDIDLTLREETTFNGSRLFIRARVADPYDLFLPQVAAGISLSGAFTTPGPGVVLFNNGSLVRYNSVTVGTLTDNSSSSGELVITFNSNASKEAVDALLQNLTYSNNNPALKNLPPKAIDITFYDGNGSSGNNQGAGGELSHTVTVNMNLLPRNDSPVLTQGTTLVTSEDVTTSAGTFYDLLSAYFQDPDGLDIPSENDLDGVAVSAFTNAGLGQWQLSLNGIDWVPLATVNSSVGGGIASERALLIGGGTLVRFVPDTHANTAGPVTRPSLTLHPVEAAIPSGAVNSGVGEAAGPVTFTTDLDAPLTHDTTANPLESRVAGASVVLDAQINALNDAPLFATGSAWSGTLIESPENGIGTEPPQQLLTGVSISDVDPSTTATLSPTVFGAGSITVAITGGVTGDRFFVTGSPGGIASQTGGTNGTNLVVNLATTATFAQVNTILEAIRFEHNTDAPPSGTRAYTVTLSDGNNLTTGAANSGGPAALTAQLGGDITITWVNDPPIVTATSLNPTFVENSAAPPGHNGSGNIYSSASVNATGTGQLIREIRYTITNIEDGTREFLRVDGYLIELTNGYSRVASYINMGSGFSGTVTVSVTGSTATISYFKATGLTTAQSQTLINGLRYYSTLDTFANTTRVVNVVYMQDTGGTDNGGNDTTTNFTVAPSSVSSSTVTIQPRNDAPVLTATLLNPTTVEQAGAETGTSPVLLFTGSSASDVDFTNASFGGGSITASLAAYVGGDVLDIASGTGLALNAVRVSGSNVQISLDGSSWTTVGTVNAVNNGQATSLVINLNASANEENLGHVMDAIRYRSTSDNPTQNGASPTRAYSLIVNDGNNNGLAGGLTSLNSNLVSGGTISFDTINDTAIADLNGPALGTDTSVNWNEVANGTHLAVTATPGAEFTDPDNTNLTQMRFTLSGLLDGNSEVLRIAGADFLLGTTYTNVDVGDFLVSYNHATGLFTLVPDGPAVESIANYQTLLRGITYNNTTDNPSAGARVFTLVLTDAGPEDDGVDTLDGPSSAFTVNVVPNNDQPVITGLTPVVFMENAINTAAATIDPVIIVTDIDSPTYDGGSLVVSGLVAGQDVVGLPEDSLGLAGDVRSNGGSVEYHDGVSWSVIGAHAGGNGANFTISFNAASNRERVQRVLEHLTFANTSDNPTLVRTLTYTLNDGGANAPLPVTVDITIRLENDAPVLAAGLVGADYVEQAAPVAILSGGITLTDPDSPANFYNSGGNIGSVTASVTDWVSGDTLSVANIGNGAGQIGVSGSTISYAGASFASFTGGNGPPLAITFTSNAATPAAVQALLAALRYSNASNDDPTDNDTDTIRSFIVTFNDGGNVKHASSTTTALTDTFTGTINVEAVNDLPVITPALAAASYTEAGAAITVDNTVTVTDADDTEITGGSISVSTGFLDGDVLAVTNSGGISGAYDAGTGVLTLSGTSTLAAYQNVLRSLTYLHTTTDPTTNGTRPSLVLTYSLTDADSDNAGAATGTATKTLNLTPVNDPPVVVAGNVATWVEEDSAEVIDPGIAITDVDDTRLASASVTISAGLTTGDVLGYATLHGITGSYSAGTGVLTLTGNATLEQYEEALSSVTFHSTSTHPTQTSATRTITWVVTDANSDGAGAQSSAPVTSTVNITPVNNPPVHTFPLAVVVNENGTLAFTGLNTISADDVDGDTLTTRLTVDEGILTVNLAGGAGISAGANGSATLTLTGTKAQVNAALATLTYQPAAHYNGGDNLNLYTLDSGIPAPALDVEDDISISVLSGNSPPIGTNSIVTTESDEPYVFTEADFGFTDPNDTPEDNFTRVLITTLPGLGVLNLDGDAVTAGQFFTVADINSGLLVYTPVAGGYGQPYTTFTFQVEDDGGTTNGGVNLDTTPRTLRIDVEDPDYIIKWGIAGADTFDGRMDATIIPSNSLTPVIYSGMDLGRFDLHMSVTGLHGNGLKMMGGEAAWFLTPNSQMANVRFRFFKPGTMDPHSVRNLHFSIEDAEPGEELSNFVYWNEHGEQVVLPWTSDVFTYSHTPSYSGTQVVENMAPLEGKTQYGKWIRVDLRGIRVTGFQFNFRKRTSSAGSIILSHLTGNPGALEFEGEFSPLVVKTNAAGLGMMPDYRAQTTWQSGVAGEVEQEPPPGALVPAGDHAVVLTLTTEEDETASIGFDMTVVPSEKPVLTVTNPRPLLSNIIGVAPFEITGTVRDHENNGIEHIEVVLNGVTFLALPGTPNANNTSAWSLPVIPVNGINSLEITAVDRAGIRSETATRTLVFTRRYRLDVTSEYSLGSVTVKGTPSTALKLDSTSGHTKRYIVQPSVSVNLTAKPLNGHIFSHWSGAPSGALLSGPVMTMTMPASDLAGVEAHFVPNPFHAHDGASNVFQGLLRPLAVEDTSNDCVGWITGKLAPATGAFSGKISLSGLVHSFAAAFGGNGDCLFNVGKSKTPTLALPGGHTLELSFETTEGVIQATLTKSGILSQGMLERGIYSVNGLVPLTLLNARTSAGMAHNNQGFFTVAMPALEQEPARPRHTYPQGDGYATLTLRNNGTLSLSGVLADGTSITGSTMLVSDSRAPVFVQLPTPGAATKGGSLGGHISLADSGYCDAHCADLLWIRPAVVQKTGATTAAKATQLYTDGWPQGISLGLIGSHYSTASSAQDTLGLDTAGSGHSNCELYLHDGKLAADVMINAFQINGNTVVKIPSTNKTFTLTVSAPKAVFNGTFTPNWTSPASAKPAFKGILLQRGGDSAGYGFFLSNRNADLNPESGRVILGAPLYETGDGEP